MLLHRGQMKDAFKSKMTFKTVGIECSVSLFPPIKVRSIRLPVQISVHE